MPRGLRRELVSSLGTPMAIGDLHGMTRKNLLFLTDSFGVEWEGAYRYPVKGRKASSFMIKGEGPGGEDVRLLRLETGHEAAGQTFFYVDGKKVRLSQIKEFLPKVKNTVDLTEAVETIPLLKHYAPKPQTFKNPRTGWRKFSVSEEDISSGQKTALGEIQELGIQIQDLQYRTHPSIQRSIGNVESDLLVEGLGNQGEIISLVVAPHGYSIRTKSGKQLSNIKEINSVHKVLLEHTQEAFGSLDFTEGVNTLLSRESTVEIPEGQLKVVTALDLEPSVTIDGSPVVLPPYLANKGLLDQIQDTFGPLKFTHTGTSYTVIESTATLPGGQLLKSVTHSDGHSLTIDGKPVSLYSYLAQRLPDSYSVQERLDYLSREREWSDTQMQLREGRPEVRPGREGVLGIGQEGYYEKYLQGLEKPGMLYHATAEGNVDNILDEGLSRTFPSSMSGSEPQIFMGELSLVANTYLAQRGENPIILEIDTRYLDPDKLQTRGQVTTYDGPVPSWAIDRLEYLVDYPED